MLNLTKEYLCTLCCSHHDGSAKQMLLGFSLCDVAEKPELSYWSDFHYQVIS